MDLISISQTRMVHQIAVQDFGGKKKNTDSGSTQQAGECESRRARHKNACFEQRGNEVWELLSSSFASLALLGCQESERMRRREREGGA